MRSVRLPLGGALLLVGVCAVTPTAAQSADHLKCYKIRDPLTLVGTIDPFLTPQFGSENDCRIGKAELLCVPSNKTNVSAIDTKTKLPIALPFSGPPQPGDQICYKVKCPKPIAPIPDQIVTDQFSSRTLSKFNSKLLCVPAVKGTAYCGDGTIDPSEDCDVTNLAGASCTSLGFQPGTLACAAGCTFDTSGCPLNPPPGTCGNGSIEGGESCDGVDLGGATCASAGFPHGGALGCNAVCAYDTSGCVRAFPATGQTTCWDATGAMIPCAGTGQDGEVQAGLPITYVDNGDGTVSDENTGLTWEKLSDDGSIHDFDNAYSWPNAFAVKIAALNTPPCFAGHCDWRVPNRRELESILDFGFTEPVVAPAFNTGCVPGCSVLACSCTLPEPVLGVVMYWSSTTVVLQPTSAWVLDFKRGGSNFGFDKTDDHEHVRAVRGGL